MMQSEQIDALASALAKAQATIKNATINKINPHFKSKYADLASVFDAVRPPLSTNGLSVTQTTEIREGAFVLVTTLAHSSGQWIKSDYPLPIAGKPQEIGSALTYARRYSLSSIAGIAADEDDDAEGAERQHQKTNGSKTAVSKLVAAPIEPPVDPETGEISPHKIAYDDNAIAWGSKYVAALKTATLVTDLAQWQQINQITLDKIKESAPKVYQRIHAAQEVRRKELDE